MSDEPPKPRAELNALPEFDVSRSAEVGAHFVDEDTPQFWIDGDGQGWLLGRYLSGEWYKRRHSIR